MDNIEKTTNTVRRVNDNLYMMEYNCSYSLDKLVESGETNIFVLARKLQKEISKNAKLVFTKPNGGCSTFNVRNKKNDYILGRNFDYKGGPSLILWTHPEEGYKSISVCDMSFMLQTPKTLKKGKYKRLMLAPYTAMEGINEKGLGIAVLEVKIKPTKQKRGKTPIATVVAIRAILDRCQNVDEAIALLDKYDMRDLLGVNYHYHLLDSSGKSVIVEYTYDKMNVIRQKEPNESLKSANFLLTPGADNSKEMGKLRYLKMTEEINKHNGIMESIDVMKLLAHINLRYTHKWLRHQVITVWSDVLNVTEKTMLFANYVNYKQLYKFSLDKPLEYDTIETNIEHICINDASRSIDLDTEAFVSGRHLFKTYGTGTGKVEALKDVNIDIYSGELLVILGSSGSGKSTLLNVLSGMDSVTSGDIFVNGMDISKFNDKQLTKYRKNNISFVFQSFNLISEITALENVMLTAKNKVDAINALRAVGLEDKKDKYPSELSGGQMQRISIARALATDCKILFCDEPTGALDYETGKNILIELERLSKDCNKTVVIVTHTREISRMADRIIEMRNGRIIREEINNNKIMAKEVEW